MVLIQGQHFWMPLYWPLCRKRRQVLTDIALHRMPGKAIEISESTLYPVLRRLLKDDCLECLRYGICGRNRRYYKNHRTRHDTAQPYKTEWKSTRLGLAIF